MFVTKCCLFFTSKIVPVWGVVSKHREAAKYTKYGVFCCECYFGVFCLTPLLSFQARAGREISNQSACCSVDATVSQLVSNVYNLVAKTKQSIPLTLMTLHYIPRCEHNFFMKFLFMLFCDFSLFTAINPTSVSVKTRTTLSALMSPLSSGQYWT